VHGLEGNPTLLDVGRDGVDHGVGARDGSLDGALVPHIGIDDHDPVETKRSQFNSRWFWMPHSNAYRHALGAQAVHPSPTKETPTTKHHNRRHHLLRSNRPAHQAYS
jgi:hypothetical protein